MGSLYRSKHELVFIYRVGTAPHLNMVELGKHGRNRTNVWDYASVNSLQGDSSDRNHSFTPDSSAGFTITTSGFKFSVHTGVQRSHLPITLSDSGQDVSQ